MLGAVPYVKEKRKNALTLCCFGRGFGGCCCCILLILLLLIAALLVFLFLIVKVPKVSFSGARAPTDRSPLQLSGSTVNLNWDFVFQVSNPNSFGASVSSLDMRAFPPNAASNIDNQIANGTKLDTYIEANGNTNVQFPVTFSLNTKQSSNSQFFAGLITACGGGGAGAAGNQISVKYELDIGLAMLKPIGYKYKHEEKASFACPINIGGNPALSAILQLIGGLANNAARGAGTAGLASRGVLDKRGPALAHPVELVVTDGPGRGRKVGRAWVSITPN
ncbi:hypothetical protein BCR44DRAFT_123224 [Catenaria anguillulae PL171]|uniref:Late embryogenesis abundant protein LEA-2 subgroup domain-containing protein n=1 Tax=Catenaria anguillulae PL171 TaxID=765915 RepID=A0A1Y2HNV5_9FUNG|nr:hypothetical protein BCR44DRAFT_123224 [Catenaria anguillulae PL171]